MALPDWGIVLGGENIGVCYNILPTFSGESCDTMTYSEIAVPAPGIEPQRLAWGVLLISFAIFCVICVISGLGVHYFLFQSLVPLTTRLEVGRGSVGITNPSNPSEFLETRARNLTGARGTTIRTDPQSQATISFHDSDHLIATVTLRSNTSLDLRDAARPRFEWSAVPYDLVLGDFSGEIDIYVAEGLPRSIRLGVQPVDGYWVIMDSGGHYLASATETQVRVTNLDGHALLIGPQNNRDIPIGGQGIVNLQTDAQIAASSASFTDLLANTVFPGTPEANELDRQPGVDVWTCANGENDNPQGDYDAELKDGHHSLRLVRDGNAVSHGDTRCIRWFGQTGQNVESFDYLGLRTTFFINFQSVNACGFEGSECPLMLRFDYVDTDGRPQRWYYGFYYKSRDPQQNYPLRCNSATCTQDHQQVNEKSWYTFDSGNLLTLFRQHHLPLPASIINVQFYASGHQYDVYVSDIALLVGQNTQAGANGEAPPTSGG
jgi:hypothetical protein